MSSGSTRAVIKIAMRRAMSLRLRERIVSPSRYTMPESSGSWPMTVFKIVDLPEPFGPMSVTIFPLCTQRGTSSMRGLPW